MVKLEELVRPQTVVFGNVLGMVQINVGIGIKRVIEDFAKMEYRIVIKLLYAPDYGNRIILKTIHIGRRIKYG